MKIIVISDSHGDTDIIQKIVRSNKRADIYLHLGDSQVNEYYLDPFVSVRGNCDFFVDYPNFRIIRTPFGNIYAEHGHLHSHVDKDFLDKHECKIYLYGHTHVHEAYEEDGYYYFNPGSVSRPRDGTTGSYLVLDLEKDSLKYEFFYL